MNKKRHSPWLWIPSISATDQIPSAVVTFVATLMFIQFGADETLTAVYGGLLFLPWVLKSFMRSKVRNAGYYKRHIHLVEGLIFLTLMGLAVYISEMQVRHWVLFLFLFAIGVFTAWHGLLVQMYYNRMLYPRQQTLYNKTKMLSTQLTMIFTYGVLIIIAGFFEVFFRSYKKAWAMESTLVAGGFLLFCAINMFVLQNPRIHNPYRYESLVGAFKNELQIVDRIKHKKNIVPVIISAFFLLLPQALMFNTRVFFLLAPQTEGGLGCSVQDVGFAQGTIGVVAFSLALALGRLLLVRYGVRKLFALMAFMLTLSPLSYYLMSVHPQVGDMLSLCLMTFFAQFCFGFGLNVCAVIIRYVSDYRYKNTINYLYVPIVSAAMLIPAMLSGWLCKLLGYETYFLINCLAAPLAWLVLIATRPIKILTSNEQQIP